MFFVLAASAVLALTVFPSLFIPKDVAVPDVAGLEYEEAVIKLEDEGFEVDPNAEDIADDKIEEGLIVKTDPAAGDIVKEGSTVKLYKSSGKEKTEVDDVVGQKVDAAKKLLEQKGFKNIKTEEVHDEEEAGTIIEQDPAAGTEIVAADDEVKLTVSLGPEAITLRDLKTYSKQAASGYLDDHQLVLVEKEAHSEDVPEGQVIKQKPEAGASVKPGDKVEVTFSLGPKQKPVKTVTEKIDIPYEPGAAGEEQNVQISIDDEEHSISDVYENFKITAPAERTIKFRIAPGQKGYYQVTINDKVVRSKTIEYPEDE